MPSENLISFAKILSSSDKGKKILTRDEVMIELSHFALYAERDSAKIKALEVLTKYYADDLTMPEDTETKKIVMLFKRPEEAEKEDPDSEVKLLNG
jgi:hypothetical protein